MNDNPLLNARGLPAFAHIRPEHVEPAIDAVLAENRATVERLLDAGDHYTWANLVQPLEAMDERLNRIWSPVSHLNSVANSESLRAAYNACLPKLSDYATEMGQNERLFRAFKSIAEGAEYPALDRAQRKIIDNALRDFHLSGIDLPPDRKARYKDIMQELSALTARFEENLLDATHAWHKQIGDVRDLAGVPESALAVMRQAAERESQSGYRLTLEYPSYMPVMTYCDNRALREELYGAYVTRASDAGPHAGRWDNTPIMDRLLALRHEEAQLLGFGNYAEYSLATKMASHTGQVMRFLEDLAERSLPMARADLDELRAFAREQHGMAGLEAWDIAYYSEKLQQHRYALSQ